MLKLIQFVIFMHAVGISVDAAAFEFIGEGALNIAGAIVETPCAIIFGDDKQSVEIDPIPVMDTQLLGYKVEKNLDINLVNCQFMRLDSGQPVIKNFRYTFDNGKDENNFKLQGTPRDVYLIIKDSAVNFKISDVSVDSSQIWADGLHLRYKINLVSQDKNITTESNRSAIGFFLDYY